MRAEPQPLIVIVEDEAALVDLLTQFLETAGMRVLSFQRAALAWRFLRSNFANLLLLDVNLPAMSGFELFLELQKEGRHLPVIFVSANAQEESVLQGLNMGGDDYITKPFSFPQVIARIRAVLRRAEGREDLNVSGTVRFQEKPFEFCGAKIIPRRLEVVFPDGKVAAIGRKTVGIVTSLHQCRGRGLTRKELIHTVWGLHANVEGRSLDQYLVKLRRLFRNHGLNMANFRHQHGVGYIYDEETKTKRDK